MDELKMKLCSDIAKIFKKNIDLVSQSTDKSLFCDPFYLTTEELLYFYFYLKKNYNLSVDENKIMEGLFQSIDKICTILS